MWIELIMLWSVIIKEKNWSPSFELSKSRIAEIRAKNKTVGRLSFKLRLIQTHSTGRLCVLDPLVRRSGMCSGGSARSVLAGCASWAFRVLSLHSSALIRSFWQIQRKKPKPQSPFLLHDEPTVSFALPPVVVQRIWLQYWHTTDVWEWEKIVLMLWHWLHLTSRK